MGNVGLVLETGAPVAVFRRKNGGFETAEAHPRGCFSKPLFGVEKKRW